MERAGAKVLNDLPLEIRAQISSDGRKIRFESEGEWTAER